MAVQKLKTISVASLLTLISLSVSAQDNQYKSNLMKLLSFFSKEASLPPGPISSLFALRVSVDRAGKVKAVEFSETVPDSLRPKLSKLKALDVNWLAFVPHPSAKNNIVIPVFRVVDRQPFKGIDFDRQQNEVGLRDYFGGIFKFERNLKEVILLDPFIVAAPEKQEPEDFRVSEEELKRAMGETPKLVNPPSKVKAQE